MGKQAEHTSWKLSEEQKERVLEWIAIFSSNREVLRLMRRYEFPEVSTETITYYRNKYGDQCEVLRERFRRRAMEKGWALKEARVALLNDMLADWGSRKPDGKEVTEMVLKVEKQLSERIDDPAVQRVKLEFDSPATMEDLMEGLEEEV